MNKRLILKNVVNDNKFCGKEICEINEDKLIKILLNKNKNILIGTIKYFYKNIL